MFRAQLCKKNVLHYSRSLKNKVTRYAFVCVCEQTASDRPIPPLPYRIAKALDPFVYRNVELDIIHEEKRGSVLSAFSTIFCRVG